MAMMALPTLAFGTTQEMALSVGSVCGLGMPYPAWRPPEMYRKIACKAKPIRMAGRRPNLSRYMMAGRVNAVFRMY
jgi:hypothetical protein